MEETATYRITDWTPYEVSIVSCPADSSVGIGRSASGAGQGADANPVIAVPSTAPSAAPAAATPFSTRSLTESTTMTTAATENLAARCDRVLRLVAGRLVQGAGVPA